MKIHKFTNLSFLILTPPIDGSCSFLFNKKDIEMSLKLDPNKDNVLSQRWSKIMRITNLFIVVFIFFLLCKTNTSLSKDFAGGDECKPNLTGFDVCQSAKGLADNFSQKLPMKVSENVLLEKVSANKGLINLIASLNYDKSQLKSLLNAGNMTEDDLLNKFKESTINIVCQPKSATAAFINLGGRIRYVYYFKDKTLYTSVNIDRTSCRSNN